MKIVDLKLSQIMLDGGTQARASVNFAYVARLAEALQRGTPVDPLTVFFGDAKYWLADGFHRARAAIDAGVSTLRAEVREGGRRDALLFGLRKMADAEAYRTNRDKRRAVLLLLADDEWAGWSNQQIADTLSVSSSFVAALRKRGSQLQPGHADGATSPGQPRQRRGDRPSAAKRQQAIQRKLIKAEQDLANSSSAEYCLVIDPWQASPDVLADAIELLKAYYRQKTGRTYPDTP